MKRMVMLLTVAFMLVPAVAHNRTVVHKLDDVLRLRNGAGVRFQDVQLSETVKYVMKLRRAKKGDLKFYLFSAKGDWGPFTGLITLEKGVVVAVDILSFTRHDSDALARPAFLDQFGGLDMMAFHRKVFRPVPGEPRNLDAVREALMIAFHDGGSMMMNSSKNRHCNMMKGMHPGVSQ